MLWLWNVTKITETQPMWSTTISPNAKFWQMSMAHKKSKIKLFAESENVSVVFNEYTPQPLKALRTTILSTCIDISSIQDFAIRRTQDTNTDHYTDLHDFVTRVQKKISINAHWQVCRHKTDIDHPKIATHWLWLIRWPGLYWDKFHPMTRNGERKAWTLRSPFLWAWRYRVTVNLWLSDHRAALVCGVYCTKVPGSYCDVRLALHTTPVEENYYNTMAS